MVMTSECGGHRLARVADALAQHQGADEAGDPGVDVDHRAASEVERAELVEVAGIARGPCRARPARWPWRVALGGGERLGGVARPRLGPCQNHTA